MRTSGGWYTITCGLLAVLELEAAQAAIKRRGVVLLGLLVYALL
jgi:hypothetical protein